MSLQAEVERVLALLKGPVYSVSERMVHGEYCRHFVLTHSPTIAALAERLAVAEERVRVLENNVIERQAWSDIQDRQL